MKCSVCDGTGIVDWVTYINNPEDSMIKGLKRKEKAGTVKELSIKSMSEKRRREIVREIAKQ